MPIMKIQQTHCKTLKKQNLLITYIILHRLQVDPRRSVRCEADFGVKDAGAGRRRLRSRSLHLLGDLRNFPRLAGTTRHRRVRQITPGHPQMSRR